MDTTVISFLLTVIVAIIVPGIAAIIGAVRGYKSELAIHAAYCSTVRMNALRARLEQHTSAIQDKRTSSVFVIPMFAVAAPRRIAQTHIYS